MKTTGVVTVIVPACIVATADLVIAGEVEVEVAHVGEVVVVAEGALVLMKIQWYGPNMRHK